MSASAAALSASSSSVANTTSSILFVCLGNICRSPLAEGIALHHLRGRGFSSWIVDSAGTSGEHDGESPDDRSISIAKKYGIDISKQISRRIRSEDYSKFEYIITMDDSNYRNVLRVRPKSATNAKIATFVSFSPESKLQEIDDPWYGGMSGFDTCFKNLDKYMPNVIDAILEDKRKEQKI